MKVEFYRQSFERILNIKFYQNPPSVSRLVPSGQIDRQTGRQAGGRTGGNESNSRFSQFCKRV